jgi:universal stress protein A
MTIRHIVCCTDFSENADAAFSAALEMAQKYAAHLTVLHVLPPVINPTLADTEGIVPEAPKESLLLKLEEKMEQSYGSRIGKQVDYRLTVLDGHESTEILRYLEEERVDVVVMGSYGLSGMGLVLFGSVAKRVAHKAPCSVLIVRHRPERT